MAHHGSSAYTHIIAARGAARTIAALGAIVAFQWGASPSAAYAGTYRFITIDAPANGTYINPVAVNAAGTVIGDYLDATGHTMAFVWKNGTLTPFSGPKSAPDTFPAAINQDGIIAGAYAIHTFQDRGFTRDARGHEHIFGLPRAFDVTLTGINDQNQIVGVATLNRHIDASIAFIAQSYSLQTLSPPGATSVSANAINNAGAVAGTYVTAASNGPIGYVYSGGVYSAFNGPNGFIVPQLSIADDGTVAGGYVEATNYRMHGFVLRRGFHLVDYPGALSTWIRGILHGGGLVGEIVNAAGSLQVFLYADGTFHPLVPPNASNTTINGSNSAGTLVGTYQDNAGTMHGYVAVCDAGQAPCTQ